MKPSDLRQGFLKSSIKREEYWHQISKMCEPLLDFTHFLSGTDNKLIVSEMGVVVEFPFVQATRVSLFLDPEDVRTASSIILSEGAYEPFISEIINSLSESSTNFVDVGANIGYYTISVAKKFPSIQIFAFEPNPIVYSKLQKNIELNGQLKNISSFNVAAGKLNGESLDFYIPRLTGSSGGSFRELHSEEGESISIKVKSALIDEVLGIREKIDLMKFDVEGAELEALEGSLAIITKDKPTIFAELLRKWMKPFKSHPQDVVKILKALDYLPLSIGEGSLSPLDEIVEETIETNFLFIHKLNVKHLNLVEKYMRV